MNKKEKIIKSADLIKETWNLYRKNVLKFIEVFVYGLIGVIPMLVTLGLISAYTASGLAQSASVFTNIILIIVAFILFLFSAYIAITYIVRAKVASILLLKNNFTSAKENFKEAKPYFIKYLGAYLLVTVLLIAWFYVLIIPALIFSIYYGFTECIVVAEDKRPFSAVERSYDLVRGYWWPVFGRLILIGFIGVVIYLFISMPLFLMNGSDTISFIYGIFVNLVCAILLPYFLIYFYNLYKSLKETNK